MTATRFDEVALSLVEHGWRPIPVLAATKQPSLRDWNLLCRDQWARADIEDAVKLGGRFSGPSYACAIAAPPELLLLDIDTLDGAQAAHVAKVADSILGETPLLRIGRAPKAARIYRAIGAGLRSRRLHPVEILCGSGCLICFGIHAGTRRPYTWVRGRSPLDTDADEHRIPAVCAEQIEKFLCEVFAVVPRTAGGTNTLKPRIFNRSPVIAAGMGGLHDELRQRARVIGFDRAVREFLVQASEGIRNDVGFAAVAACVGRGWDPKAIRELFSDHWIGWEGFSAKHLESAIERLVDPASRWSWRADQTAFAVRVECQPPPAVIFRQAPWHR